jgi:hypothetical protein
MSRDMLVILVKFCILMDHTWNIQVYKNKTTIRTCSVSPDGSEGQRGSLISSHARIGTGSSNIEKQS